MQTAILAVQVYVDGAIPVFFRNPIYSSGGAGNAGAIDQHVDAAKFRLLRLEKRCDLPSIGYIGVTCLPIGE
jgi:hypothetical protein